VTVVEQPTVAINAGLSSGLPFIAACDGFESFYSDGIVFRGPADFMRPLIVLLLIQLSTPAFANIVLNEIMASNTRAFPDIVDFEDYPDWIELKNTANTATNLSGFFLSDNPANPFKWSIPSGTIIPANGFLLIMADGHDAAPGQTFPRGYWPWKNFVTERYHANFSLGAEGESVSLIQGNGLSSVALVNASTPLPTPPETVAVWKYKDDGTDLSTQWRAGNYDDSAWASGPSELGYGDSPATVVSYGPSSGNKYITTYFRHHFTVSNPAAYHGLALKLLVDDGCIVYLNGVEVVRRNLPGGEVNYKTLASAAIGGADETTFFSYSLSASDLIAGDNVLAVEVHQSGANSSDLSFDLGLTAFSHAGFTAIDNVAYSQQIADVSYGRDSSDPSIWRQFAVPSPGSENTTEIVNDIRLSGNDVSVSLPAGFYQSDQVVSLSSPGGVIHYTLDGSNPTTASPVFSSPLTISTTTVLRARSFEPGKTPGPIATRTYFRGETIANVPYVSVVADPNTLFGDEIGIYKNEHETVTGSYGLKDVYKNKDAPGNVEFFDPNGSGFSAGCGIRIGGENNWVHPQKALNIAIRGKYGTDDVTYNLFPGSQIPVHTAFTLRDGGDNWNKDMLRDCLYPRLAHGFLNVDTADYRPSIVFINGAYYGLHDLRQRWDDTWFAQQYHLPADQIDHLLYGHIDSAATTLGVDKGSTSDWLELLDFLDASDLTTPANWAYVESKIDVDSFIDFVISESYGNNTAWHHNREFWKPKGPSGRWRWFLTDMDRTFFTSSLTGMLGNMLSTDEVLIRLKTNSGFTQRLAQRYAAHMASTFNPSRVQSIISQMDTEVSALIPRHVARWAPNGTTVTARNSNIQQIKDYATQRAANIYSELTAQLGVPAPVDFTLAINNSAQGTVLVEGVPVSASTFKLFPNVPFTLKAEPSPGYAFSGWDGAEGGDTITVTIANAETITANFVPSGESVIGGTLANDTTLTLAGSPYALSTDLIVPTGVTLTIQAGVTINMAAQRNIRVQGVLEIAGTAEQPVMIHGRNGARWGGISFEDPPLPSILEHLIIRGATKGYDPTVYTCAISGHNANVNLSFLDISDSEGPVNMLGGTCELKDSVLYDPYTGDGAHFKQGSVTIQRCTFIGNNAPDTDAIDVDGIVSGLIEDCKIYRFQGSNSDGIDVGEGAANLLIQGNLIYFNSDKGVSVGQGSKVTLRRNLVVGCNLGVGVKDAGSLAVIDQNTFAQCNTGVAVYEKNFGVGGGAVFVTNSIISKAAADPVTVDSYSSLSVAYSLSDTFPLFGSNNLLADPHFVDPAILNFQLQPGSIAIDHGDPAHPLDPDNSIADIGAEYTFHAADYPYTIGETVVINEILANSGPASDWIELHNRTVSPIDIGGWFLSDSGSNLLKYRIPLGTIIPAQGFCVFTESDNFGASSVDTNKIAAFALSDVGETVYLSSAVNDQLTDYRTKEDFGPSTEGESLGLYYKAGSDSYNFVAMKSQTPGAPNSLPRVGPIVISEIMYNPQGSGTGDAEYIELLNVSEAPVTLYDSVKGKPWRITDGIEMDFPALQPLVMAPGERVILTKNANIFASTFGSLVPAGTQILEWSAGSLDNGGETLQLDRPGAVDDLNVQHYVRQDRVNYDDAAPWPVAADGKGSSLNRIVETDYGNDFINWMAAAPSPGKENAVAPTDSDADGMPDAWELNHFGNLAHDGTDDFDGDGISDLAEFLAGSDPRNGNDGLRVELVIDAGTLNVRFLALAGQTYSVQYKTTLIGGSWLTLRQVPAQSTTTLIQIDDSDGTHELQRFYRIVTPQQP